MARALELAARADYRTSPNPMVGSVVLDSRGALAGEGYHERAGAPHGEAAALAAAGERARDGTVYVTLEPCTFAGRTPPCADALIAAGVRRVVVAMEDPDPRVRGRGVERLREAGIEVIAGVGAAAAERLNEFYVRQRLTGRPFVALKWAMTIDGRTATEPGEPRWITGSEARRHVHELRHRYDAILVGVNTVLADDPRLTTRLEDRADTRSPLRVVLDRHLRTPPTAAVLPALIFSSAAGSTAAREALEAAGAEVIASSTDPAAVLDELGRRGMLSLLVEGGPQVHRSFAPFADRVLAYVAPAFGGDRRLARFDARRLGGDILLEGDVHRDHH